MGSKLFISVLFLFLLQGCGSHVSIHPRGCSPQTILMEFDPTLYVYSKQYDDFKANKALRGKVDFIIDYGVVTPMGNLVDHRVYLDDILKEQDLDCDDVAEVAYSFKNTAYDMLLSFVPFFSRKTLIVYGRLRKESLQKGNRKIRVPDVNDIK